MSESASRRKSAEDSDSRIPLPRPSPGVFRRSSSMRLRGEKGLPAHRGTYFSSISESGGPSEPWGAGTSSRLPNRNRSLSLSGSTAGSYPHTPTPSPDEDDDADLDSLRSFGSACSAMSCDHAYFARNGTTFSGRRMKYVVHCSPHGGSTDEYLTPTQRANRQIRRLKVLLQQTQKDLDQKDQDIFRLTKEVVELRLFKASLDLAQDRVDCSSPTDVGPPPSEGDPEDDKPGPEPENLKVACPALMEKTSSPSLADSGHFEDMASSATPEPATYDKRLQESQRMHAQECQELKERHNDRVENLLQRLSDVNNRYCELRSEYDRAQDTVRQLERETESLRKSMEEHEDRHKNMYLKMYMKGQEAARIEHADQVMEFAQQAPTRVSVPELLQQLQMTQNELENIKAMYRRIVESRAGKGELDPEITLQFLKSAIYYFLTDKENHQGHLNAIESILGYTETEKLNIEKAYKMYPKK